MIGDLTKIFLLFYTLSAKRNLKTELIEEENYLFKNVTNSGFGV